MTRRVLVVALLLFSNFPGLARADGALVLCEDETHVELRQEYCRDGERVIDWSVYREMAPPARVVLARSHHDPEEGLRMAAR